MTRPDFFRFNFLMAVLILSALFELKAQRQRWLEDITFLGDALSDLLPKRPAVQQNSLETPYFKRRLHDHAGKNNPCC